MDQNRNSISDSVTQRFYGLINQGSTCYLNSVLQVLFMTKDFREAVKRSPKDNKEHIDHQLHKLFEKLSKGTAKTVEVTKKLGIDSVNKQHDAAEYLEKILTLTSKEASQIFDGQLTNRTVCECGEETDEKKPFWNLPLPLSNSSVETYRVVDGIQEFFKDSCFHGDDQLYCEKCEAKRDATVSCIMKQHPEVLMLLLKRFEFNYHYMSYIKNTCVVEVPLTVIIPENQKYELYAFVNHYGSLTGGHYTATIRSQDDQDRWYNFNDSSVTQLDNQPFKKGKLETSENAYILFYRKKSKKDTNNNGKVSNTHSPLLDNSKTNDWCQPGSKRKNEGGAGGTKEKVRIKNSSNDLSAEESTHLWDENLHYCKDHVKQHSGMSCSEKGNVQTSYSHNGSDRQSRKNQGEMYLGNRKSMKIKVDPGNKAEDLVAANGRKNSEKSDNSGHTGREDGDRSHKIEKSESDSKASRRINHRKLNSPHKNAVRETRDHSEQQNSYKDKICEEDPSGRKHRNPEHQGGTKVKIRGNSSGKNKGKIDLTEAEQQAPRRNVFKQQSEFARDEKRPSSRSSMQRRHENQCITETESQRNREITPVGQDQQKKETSGTKEQKRSGNANSESINSKAPLIRQAPEMKDEYNKEENLIPNHTPQTMKQSTSKKQSFRRFFKRFCCCCCHNYKNNTAISVYK